MGTVFELNRKKVFTLQEAQDLLPIIRRVTDDTNARVKHLLSLLEVAQNRGHEKATQLEGQITQNVNDWQTKIEKLGAEGKGLWLVDFDCGTGYYCWKYPEDTIEHFHGYTEGFQSRVKISSLSHSNLNHCLDHFLDRA